MASLTDPVTIWTTLTGTGTLDDPYRPDLPAGVPFSAEIPSELDPSLPTIEERESAPDGKHLGAPAVTCCRVRVNRYDLPRITTIVRPEDVPEEDRLLINVCAVIRKPRGVVDEAAVEKIFAALGDLSAAAPERKRRIIRVLEHAGWRGLRAAKRLAIAERLGVADVDMER